VHLNAVVQQLLLMSKFVRCYIGAFSGVCKVDHVNVTS